MNYKIVKDDALEFIKKTKEQFRPIVFDAIITDPPYNISRENNFKTMGRAGIKFGQWDYKFDQTTWIKAVAPLLKNGGSIIIFNSWKNLGLISQTLEETGFNFKDVLRWIKSNPMPRNTNRRYVSDFECAVWTVKGNGKWTFNKPTDKPYLRPEFKYPVVAKSKDKIHPTQKNHNLLKELISIHTNEGDLILDLFAGSGSTGVAALELGRSFFGCELDENYYEKAKSRLQEQKIKTIFTNHFG